MPAWTNRCDPVFTRNDEIPTYDEKDTSTWTCLQCRYITDGCPNWMEEGDQPYLNIRRQRSCCYQWDRSLADALADSIAKSERGSPVVDDHEYFNVCDEPEVKTKPTPTVAHMLCLYASDHEMDRGHTCTRDFVDCPYPIPNSAECTAQMGEIMVSPSLTPRYDWKELSVDITVPYNRIQNHTPKKPWYKRLWDAICIWAEID